MMNKTDSTVKDALLTDMRALMHKAGVDACLIPSADPHLSEYLPDYWQIRAWLTAFTGSVGTVVVTQDFAGVWVDSRYWVQAENELAGTVFQLMKIGTAADQAHTQWLAEHVPEKGVVAVDGRALGVAAREALEVLLSPRGIRLDLSLDIAGQCWGDRPGLPAAAIRDLPLEFAGQSRAEKLERVREVMRAQGAQWHLVSTLDDIAWLLNLRGSDVSYNPVFMSHALIGLETALLFALPGKVDAALARLLAKDGVEVRPYDSAAQVLAGIDATDRLMLDPARTTCALFDCIRAQKLRVINPSTFSNHKN